MIRFMGTTSQLLKRRSIIIYPEILVGNVHNFELNIKPLLDSLFEQTNSTEYFHHVDKYENVWLSFDFGAYPGESLCRSDVLEVFY